MTLGWDSLVILDVSLDAELYGLVELYSGDNFEMAGHVWFNQGGRAYVTFE